MSSCSVLPLQLLMLVVAYSHAVSVRSDPGSGYSIETGNLKSVETKLSIGSNQQAWWRLAGPMPGWHDSAITRFFAAGPLKAAEMQALAAQNQKHDSWTASQIKSTQHYTDLQALQKISTATYRLKKFIVGTGKIEASLCTLLFKCVGTNCSEGYLVPIVIVPATAAGRASNDSAYVYATLWLPATSSFLVNAVPSFILSEANPFPIALSDASDGFSLHLNVRDHGLTSCPNTAVANCRTLLDGAYGLLPATACIRLSSTVDQSTSFNLLVSVPSSFTVSSNGNNTDYFPSVESFLFSLGVTNVSWVLQPFEACSEEAVLMPSVDGLFLMCYQASCKGLLRANVSCGSSDQAGVLLLKSMLAYMKASPECTAPQLGMYINVSCQSLATSERCKFGIFRNDDTDSGGSMLTVSPNSRWISTKGLDTKEFQSNSFDSHSFYISAEHAPCTVEEPSLSRDGGITAKGSSLPTAIRIRGRAYLAGYIAEHNIAFNTSRGPPTDLYTFIALVVSTAFSVILAISGPFTKFLLREICRRHPRHLENQRGKARQAAKVCVQVGCNVVLSMVSFLPVLSVAMNELQREKAFYTWDLASSDVDAFDHSEAKIKLRVIYLLSAVSHYDSHFLTAITFVICVTCFIVAACTSRRCIQIFARYRLLKDYDVMTGASYGVESVGTELQRALSAIEMTEAEYVKLTKQIEQIVALEDQRPLLPRRIMNKAPTPAHEIWCSCYFS